LFIAAKSITLPPPFGEDPIRRETDLPNSPGDRRIIIVPVSRFADRRANVSVQR
jgi:hypothetical protein